MQRMHRSTTPAVLVAVFATAMVAPARAQDPNFPQPVTEIEMRLREHNFDIIDRRGSRAPGDRTTRVLLSFEDSVLLLAKWANAGRGASTFNNEPRFEIAAYEIQKLFLDPDDYVVPPTVLRPFPIDYAELQRPGAQRTFSEASSVLVVLQYWLPFVSPDNYWNPRRAQDDTVYARHIGNFNVLTHLIRHQDSNIGNYLISQVAENPRVFAVDNGVSFGSEASNRGTEWRELRVRQLSRSTVERLRSVTRDDLERGLAVLAEFEISGDQLIAVPPGENLGRNRGVRRSGNRVQLGLTRIEIDAVENRLRNILRQVERGRITEF
ncbi:hypothetical protein BH23GEM9_BH23GEM9_09220 [soil metagenome]